MSENLYHPLMPKSYEAVLDRYYGAALPNFASPEFPLDLLVTPDPFFWRYAMALALRAAEHRMDFACKNGPWRLVRSTYALEYLPGASPTSVLVTQDARNMQAAYADMMARVEKVRWENDAYPANIVRLQEEYKALLTGLRAKGETDAVEAIDAARATTRVG